MIATFARHVVSSFVIKQRCHVDVVTYSIQSSDIKITYFCECISRCESWDQTMQAATSGYDSPFQLSEFQLIDLSHGGRTLQMRTSQLTATNITRAFWLIPETIILVSERDTVALPQDGVFHDVDDCYTWTVEGEKATTNIPVAPMGSNSRKVGGESRWKPQASPLLCQVLLPASELVQANM